MIELKMIISDQAIYDLEDIWLYIATDSPAAADKFIDFLYKKCELLKSAPEMGRNRDELLPGIRSFVVHNYIIFYRIKEKYIEIVRILSGYRDIDSIF